MKLTSHDILTRSGCLSRLLTIVSWMIIILIINLIFYFIEC
nr:MAG TPA: hypothetical protein [Crassvirales sp.]